MSSVRPKKHLGQHFLKDLSIAERIAKALTGHGEYNSVLEVGPGTGVLTQFLLKEAYETWVVDIDKESIAYLQENFKALEGRIIDGDFLKYDFLKDTGAPLAIIGNFPYNISSQIFFRILDFRNDVPEVVCMIQKEVADRIAEPPGSKTYGILSVLLQAYYDIEYLFTVKQRVINNSGREVTLFPFSLVAQHGLPEDLYGRWIVHEGPIGYIDGELTELSYKKIQDKPLKEVNAAEGWIGMTEHYWLTSLFPEVKEGNQFRFLFKEPEAEGQLPTFQVDVMGAARSIAAGETTENTTHFFAGPKKLSLLEDYEKQLELKHMDLSVDFGMYYFMTKPLYYLLHWLRDIVGNFGIAIILLTVLVRFMVFPLANKSFKSFAGLRKIAPKMTELREKYGDDREKLQAELVKLYEKEGVNPMAGCMPILIQIPIFFALFKVFQISIEMRHEPFYGWINDLSAPDPTSIFNLFGLIPWDPPQQLMIGAWPCLMLVFLIIQKKMNPPPQDKMQKVMMDFMPFFITYLLSGFAAGLVIYWTFSNALSVVQQYIIMTNMGVKPELFKSKAQKEEERKMREANVHPGMEMLKDDLKEAEEKFEDALFGDEEEQKAAQPPKEISKPKPKKSKKKK